MTYAEMMHRAAEDAVRATHTYFGASNETEFRKHFEQLIKTIYHPQWVTAIREDEKVNGMIALMYNHRHATTAR